MLIEGSYIDYLTLSEPHQVDVRPLLWVLTQDLGEPEREARRIGYDGKMYTFRRLDDLLGEGSFFYGERDWKGKHWSLLIASGESAHFLMEHLWSRGLPLGSDIRCTRIDTQITCLWPEGLFYLRNLEISQKVCATVIHGLDNDHAWAETLYLGARTAPVMVRAYRKRVDQSGNDWLRVEVEWKKEASKVLFWEVLADQEVGNWFLPVLERCPELYDLIKPWVSDYPDKPLTYRVVGNTLAWLSTTVANCVCRLLNDHDQHAQMAELVRQWYEYSLICQNRQSGVESV